MPEMTVTRIDNTRPVERMLRRNGQYLVTVHNGHIVKVQSVDEGMVLVPGEPAAAAATDGADADEEEEAPAARKPRKSQ